MRGVMPTNLECMADLSSVGPILAAIRQYSDAYCLLQSFQDSSGLIPPGDQKTGCIGEFFVYLYLSSKHPRATLTFAGHSNKGWDIEMIEGTHRRRIQTKTVSAFSKTRRISPISRGWDELFLVYLGRDLMPAGFWILTDPSIVPDQGQLKHCSAPDPTGRFAGTGAVAFGSNRIAELRQFIDRFVAA